MIYPARGMAILRIHPRLATERLRLRPFVADDADEFAILAGTLLHPLGLVGRRTRFHADPLERRIELGLLPVARRDVERLQQIFSIMPRVMDIDAPGRAQRALLHRSSLDEALTWIEIFGDRPDVVEHWRELKAQRQQHEPHHVPSFDTAPGPYRRRRRRRRGPRRNPSA